MRKPCTSPASFAKIPKSTEIELVQLNTDDSFVVPLLNAKMLGDFLRNIERTQFWAIEPLLLDVSRD